MPVFVPFRSQNTGDTVEVVAGFDSSLKIKSTAEIKAVKALYKKIAPLIHKHKNEEMIQKLETIAQANPSEYHWLKVDYFSSRERLFFLLCFAFLGMLIFIPLFSLVMQYLASLDSCEWHGRGIDTVTKQKIYELALPLLVLMNALYLFGLTLFYHWFFPGLIFFYERVLRSSSLLRQAHLQILGRFLHLFYTTDYQWRINESISDS